MRRPAGFIEPCQPTRVQAPPLGEKWIHEIKQDGYRLLTRVERGKVTLWTRRGNDWTDRYALVAGAAAALRARSALVDGEVIVQDAEGRADFAALQGRSRVDKAIVFAFDLLELNGRDLRQRPLEERRARLAELIDGAPVGVHLSDHFEGSGAEIFAAASAAGLEGIVSKRLGSTYRSGSCDYWQKTLCEHRETVIVTEYATPENDALVLFVARERAGELEPAGYVSLVGEGADVLLERVAARALRHRAKGRTPVEPGIILDVVHRGAPTGELRHAKILGAAEAW